MEHAFLACPVVEVAAHATHSLVGVGHSQMGCLEGFIGLQDILAADRVDAGIDVMLTVGHGVHAQLVVTTPAECETYGAACLLLGTAIEGEHQFGSVEVGVACSVAVANGFDTLFQWLHRRLGFGSPVAMQVGHPYIALPQGQLSAVEAFQDDGLLLLGASGRKSGSERMVCGCSAQNEIQAANTFSNNNQGGSQPGRPFYLQTV